MMLLSIRGRKIVGCGRPNRQVSLLINIRFQPNLLGNFHEIGCWSKGFLFFLTGEPSKEGGGIRGEKTEQSRHADDGIQIRC